MKTSRSTCQHMTSGWDGDFNRCSDCGMRMGKAYNEVTFPVEVEDEYGRMVEGEGFWMVYDARVCGGKYAAGYVGAF